MILMIPAAASCGRDLYWKIFTLRETFLFSIFFQKIKNLQFLQNVAHILKGVLINYLVIEGGFPSEILSIYGNIRCFFEILKMLICNFLADLAQCAMTIYVQDLSSGTLL